MFERRLRAFLFVLACAPVFILLRLVQLQIVHGDEYRRLAEDALMLPPRPLPFVRGAIRDARGELLVGDAPAWNLTVDFRAIAAEFDETGAARVREAKRWARARRVMGLPPVESVESDFSNALNVMWSELERFASSTGLANTSTPRDRAKDIYANVLRIRAAVAERRGFDAPIAEETEAHAVVTELDADQQIQARERFAAFSWIHVDAASERRFAPNGTPFAHLLGRVGAVDAESIARDANADDPLAAYRPNETKGISGVEWAAESTLRGRRGRILLDRDGNVVDDLPAQDGSDVTLTLVAPLQRQLYELLGRTVDQHPDAGGGAIVVLDVATRDVLALISYPSYDPNHFSEQFAQLRDDTDRLPLLFRAVATRYPPGSTVKPLVALGGMADGVIRPESREECTGYLLPDHPDRWRCWEVHGTQTRMAHGLIDVEEALTGSCNVFMYKLGESLGVDRICRTFDMVGVGRSSGIGLREDEPGINPTASWLSQFRQRAPTPGSARLFAIGQGELSMTPIQVANLVASYANGKYRPATLIRGGPPTPEWTLPGDAGAWGAIRRGIYGVVNHPEGTAYKYAHFVNDRFALCGKTGSATAHPWPTAYRIPYTDEYRAHRETLVREGGKGPALDRFQRDNPLAVVDPGDVEVAERWPRSSPEDGGNHAHAWFAGFLQPLDAAGRPEWSRTAPVAFSALVEFGGSGGRTSGPLAKEIASILLEVLGPDLNAHRESERRSP